jgi:hypothetical protein
LQQSVPVTCVGTHSMPGCICTLPGRLSGGQWRQNGLDGERERGTRLAPVSTARSSQICPGAAGGVGGDARAWPRGSCGASLKIAGLNFSVRRRGRGRRFNGTARFTYLLGRIFHYCGWMMMAVDEFNPIARHFLSQSSRYKFDVK